MLKTFSMDFKTDVRWKLWTLCLFFPSEKFILKVSGCFTFDIYLKQCLPSFFFLNFSSTIYWTSSFNLLSSFLPSKQHEEQQSLHLSFKASPYHHKIMRSNLRNH
jgi:hypothetical protein